MTEALLGASVCSCKPQYISIIAYKIALPTLAGWLLSKLTPSYSFVFPPRPPLEVLRMFTL